MIGKKYEKPTFNEFISMLEIEITYYRDNMKCPLEEKGKFVNCNYCEYTKLCGSILNTLVEIKKARKEGLI